MAGKILRGNLKLGADQATAVDVSLYVTQFTLLLATLDVVKPATWGDVTQQTLMGAEQNTLTLAYFTDEAADSVTSLLLAGFQGRADMYFEGTFDAGTVSATNEVFFGQFVPKTTEKGGTAGTLGLSTSTFPVNSWGHSPTVVP